MSRRWYCAPRVNWLCRSRKAFSEYGQFFDVRVLAVYGGQPYGPQITRLNKGVDVVVGTPGRMLDLLERNCLNLSRVQTVVLDEADEMLSMGFIDDIETILAGTPAERQTALFSATLPTPIRRLADRYMHNPQSVTIQREQVTVAAIEQRCYIVNGRDKLAALTRIFEMEEDDQRPDLRAHTCRHRGTVQCTDGARFRLRSLERRPEPGRARTHPGPLPQKPGQSAGGHRRGGAWSRY